MNILTSILLICAALLTLAWPVAAQRRLVAKAARRFLALPRLEQVLVAFAICILTVCAQKSGSNAVVNAEGVGFNAEITELGRRGEESLVGRDVRDELSLRDDERRGEGRRRADQQEARHEVVHALPSIIS